MFRQLNSRTLRTLAFGALATAAIGFPALSEAAPPHFAGGYHGAYGFHGGYAIHPGYGGYRGYGYRGYGYRGYYGWRGGWGWGGWGWGWPSAFWLGALPLYYSTWWWGGVPYYYAYDNYYTWNTQAGQYQMTAPPSGLLATGAPAPAPQGQAPGAPGNSGLFAYPKNGQTAEQQARDKQECRDWAATQAPGGSSNATGAIAAAGPQNSEVLQRAEGACLEGRGYSVK